ncbi:MAG: hypothetical protein ACR2L8_13960 [Solirubrobacteraceae bacterium]
MKLLNGAGERRVADSVIRDPAQHTVMDERGAVRSIQAADISMPAGELQAIWTPMHLERLARTYWRYLSRVTLGLIRVAYTPTERAVVLIARPFVLLRFHAPEYSMDADRGIVRWRIRDGILVASEGRGADGFLEIDVRRCPGDAPRPPRVHVEVEIASFYPAIALRVARWFYTNTQSRIHVLVTHGFLRSLAKLDLEESAVGRFAVPESGARAGADGGGPQESADVTVGDTPWPLVGALAAGAALVLALLVRRRG